MIDAYLDGLEAAEGDLSRISSVASFFISRVDSAVDARLDEIGSPEALALKASAKFPLHRDLNDSLQFTTKYAVRFSLQYLFGQ